jgi:TetR/AcrR family transcriptional regulator, repressor for neighboring sulfatase
MVPPLPGSFTRTSTPSTGRRSNRGTAEQRPRGRPPKSPGVPSGPGAVRRAILEAATELFCTRGPESVSLRDVAQRAGVNHALIGRYVGNRRQLVDEVYTGLAAQVAEEFVRDPLHPLDFAPDAAPQRLFRLLAHLMLGGERPSRLAEPSPLHALIDSVRSLSGADDETAAIRGAHLAASALGWRLFESFLIVAAGLEDTPIEQIREQHQRMLLSSALSRDSPSTL